MINATTYIIHFQISVLSNSCVNNNCVFMGSDTSSKHPQGPFIDGTEGVMNLL